MTAEIAVMNKHAVALAADSAVTTGGPGREKIFNTTNKLFALSREHPVGVMIWGYVEHSGVPLETIIKEARVALGQRAFPRVSDYVDFFFDFLLHHKLASHEYDENSISMHCFSIFEACASIVHRMDSPSRNVTALIQEQYDNFLKNVVDVPGCPVCSGMSFRRFRSLYKGSVDVAIALAFEKIDLSNTAKMILHHMAHSIITHYVPTDYTTGIVFAGFGEDEWFPSLYHYTINGTVDKRVRYRMDTEIDVDRYRETGGIFAFAQRRMVNRFMDGIDPAYRGWFLAFLKDQMTTLSQEILKEHTPLSEEERAVAQGIVERQLVNVLADAEKAAERFQQTRFTDPIVDIVQRSPKEELASIAEALVSLSALERRMSVGRESVGGPIDVALVSKGDGLIWIKRKHYFEIALNRQFWHKQFYDVGRRSDGER